VLDVLDVEPEAAGPDDEGAPPSVVVELAATVVLADVTLGLGLPPPKSEMTAVDVVFVVVVVLVALTTVLIAAATDVVAAAVAAVGATTAGAMPYDATKPLPTEAGRPAA
jgi:hypothetical protein